LTTIDIADLDCIYLSYDEPQKEEFWVKIRNMVPWAKRVDGVRGSDAAHKAAAEASDTERFILIDGDNLPEESFFNQTIEYKDENYEQAVYRWRARNHVNGLMYGNGGMSSWTKTFVRNMRTHEVSSGADDTDVEFCFDDLYWPMYNCYSTTYPDGSAKHAWRAGFREGVKMCLNRGTKPSSSDFRESVHNRNLDHLTIWHNVGSDTEHGLWAIAGARLGTWKTMMSSWDYKEVQDFTKLDAMWEDVKHMKPGELINLKADDLNRSLGLPMNIYTPVQSKFFKHHYCSNWHNKSIMTREIDIIKMQEGW
jgi:hypothetical protein